MEKNNETFRRTLNIRLGLILSAIKNYNEQLEKISIGDIDKYEEKIEAISFLEKQKEKLLNDYAEYLI